MEKYVQWDNTSLFWVLVLQADTVILKISCSASGTFICLAHYVGPLTGSLMGKPRGNVSEMLFFAQTVAFSLKKKNPKHNEPHVAERILQFLLSGS